MITKLILHLLLAPDSYYFQYGIKFPRDTYNYESNDEGDENFDPAQSKRAKINYS